MIIMKRSECPLVLNHTPVGKVKILILIFEYFRILRKGSDVSFDADSELVISDQCAANWCTNLRLNCSIGFRLGFGDGLAVRVMVRFGTPSTFREWARVRVLGYGFGIRGKKSHVTACWRVI